jgi:hypothetical protein
MLQSPNYRLKQLFQRRNNFPQKLALSFATKPAYWRSGLIWDQQRRLTMGEEDKSDRKRLKDFQAQLLAKETGITEAQARELIKLIGTDRASLLREARFLKSGSKR